MDEVFGTHNFADVWVLPFPNDAGSAIGAACAGILAATGNPALTWNVFSGPELVHTSALPPHWKEMSCQIEELAGVLHRTGEPVVVLSGSDLHHTG